MTGRPGRTAVPGRADPPSTAARTLFAAGDLQARELGESDIPALQRFFAANPEYFVAVNGAPPRDDEAAREFADMPPPGMPFARRWMIGFVDEAGRLAAMASILADFLAAGVWHVGLFIVATPLHGTGASGVLYRRLEDWMRAGGARWIRLGAVLGNRKAERFWEKAGYVEVRRRPGVPIGERTCVVRVFVKPLGGATQDEYLRLVGRDRPDSTLP
jgi:GNAT superfamily N-acetyltransferase